MGTNLPPIQPEPAQLPITDAQLHYEGLIAFFKNLIWLTGVALAAIVGVGAWVFHTSLQETLNDVRAKATVIATEEAHKRVSDAFEEKTSRRKYLGLPPRRLERSLTR
jgi:hypothetical protein